MTQALNMDKLAKWIGREERTVDTITAGLIARFQATLGSGLFGLHWCLAPPTVSIDDVGLDGHPKKGGFLPPVPLQYRMWAAGEIMFLSPIPNAGEVERHSVIEDVTFKEGRTGPLVFVNILHRYSANKVQLLSEQQTIVYKETATAAKVEPSAPFVADFEKVLKTDPVLLFRYSALTFNGYGAH